jgi:phospholipid transport system transporter-binding protein
MSLSITFTADNVLLSGVLNNQTIERDLFVSHQREIALLDTLKIDLQGLTNIDSAGLAWLLNLYRDAHAAKKTLAWDHIPDKLLQLARLSSAESFFVTSQS